MAPRPFEDRRRALERVALQTARDRVDLSAGCPNLDTASVRLVAPFCSGLHRGRCHDNARRGMGSWRFVWVAVVLEFARSSAAGQEQYHPWTGPVPRFVFDLRDGEWLMDPDVHMSEMKLEEAKDWAKKFGCRLPPKMAYAEHLVLNVTDDRVVDEKFRRIRRALQLWCKFRDPKVTVPELKLSIVGLRRHIPNTEKFLKQCLTKWYTFRGIVFVHPAANKIVSISIFPSPVDDEAHADVISDNSHKILGQLFRVKHFGLRCPPSRTRRVSGTCLGPDVANCFGKHPVRPANSVTGGTATMLQSESCENVAADEENRNTSEPMTSASESILDQQDGEENSMKSGPTKPLLSLANTPATAQGAEHPRGSSSSLAKWMLALPLVPAAFVLAYYASAEPTPERPCEPTRFNWKPLSLQVSGALLAAGTAHMAVGAFTRSRSQPAAPSAPAAVTVATQPPLSSRSSSSTIAVAVSAVVLMLTFGIVLALLRRHWQDRRVSRSRLSVFLNPAAIPDRDRLLPI